MGLTEGIVLVMLGLALIINLIFDTMILAKYKEKVETLEDYVKQIKYSFMVELLGLENKLEKIEEIVKDK